MSLKTLDRSLGFKILSVVLPHIQWADAADVIADIWQFAFDQQLVHQRRTIGCSHDAEVIFLDVVE